MRRQAELERKETLDDLAARLPDAPYASIYERTAIREYPERLFLYEACGVCRGSGSVPCDSCKGRGKVACSDCGGSGTRTCSTCHGSGYVSRVRMNYSNNKMESRSEPCSCRGSGKKKCKNCGGKGLVSCPSCKGTGWHTTVIRTVTYTEPFYEIFYKDGTPEYVHPALSKAGFARLGVIGGTEYECCETDYGQGSVSLNYSCSVPFCMLAVVLFEKHYQWTLYGISPEVYDADNALDEILESDLRQFQEFAGGAKRFLPIFPFVAKKRARVLMNSEINQDIFQAALVDDSAERLYDAVNRTVSVSYIERTLKSMGTFVRFSMFWLATEWLLMLSCGAVLFPLLWHVWSVRQQPLSFTPGQARLVLFAAKGSFVWGKAFFSLLFTFVAGMIVRFLTNRWLRRTGGKSLFQWASRKKLLLSKKSLYLFMLCGFIASGYFYGLRDVWVDNTGKVYGVLPLYKVIESKGKTQPKPKTPKSAAIKNSAATSHINSGVAG